MLTRGRNFEESQISLRQDKTIVEVFEFAMIARYAENKTSIACVIIADKTVREFHERIL